MNLPSNFTLKTGFNPLIENNVNKEFIATIMSMVTIFSEEAMVLASNYTIYNGRDQVTTNDLIKALKYRALDNNPEYWENPEIITKMRTIYNDYINEDLDYPDESDNENDSENENENENDSENENENESDNESDNENENENESDNDNEMEDYQYLDVSQTVLDKMNNIDEIWKQFEPTDNSELILKNAIENTEKKFQQ